MLRARTDKGSRVESADRAILPSEQVENLRWTRELNPRLMSEQEIFSINANA